MIGLLHEPARDPHLDIALGPALLQHAARAGGSEVLRIYRPRPTVVFSGRDSAAPGFGRVVAAAREHRFEPVRRGAGGRAVAYHGGALCIDQVCPDTPELASIRERFAVFGDLLARTL